MNYHTAAQQISSELVMKLSEFPSVDTVKFPVAVFEKHPLGFMCQVKSDIMAPTIPENWLILVDFEKEKPVQNGETGLVLVGAENTPMDEWFPCRTLLMGDQVLLMFDNPKYESVTVPATDIRICGVICWTQPPFDDLHGKYGHWLTDSALGIGG